MLSSSTVHHLRANSAQNFLCRYRWFSFLSEIHVLLGNLGGVGTTICCTCNGQSANSDPVLLSRNGSSLNIVSDGSEEDLSTSPPLSCCPYVDDQDLPASTAWR
jgi:hypothetical protein